MAGKQSVFKKIFSKSNKDCCSVEIEEVDSSVKGNSYDKIKKEKENKKDNSNNKA